MPTCTPFSTNLSWCVLGDFANTLALAFKEACGCTPDTTQLFTELLKQICCLLFYTCRSLYASMCSPYILYSITSIVIDCTQMRFHSVTNTCRLRKNTAPASKFTRKNSIFLRVKPEIKCSFIKKKILTTNSTR